MAPIMIRQPTIACTATPIDSNDSGIMPSAFFSKFSPVSAVLIAVSYRANPATVYTQFVSAKFPIVAARQEISASSATK